MTTPRAPEHSGVRRLSLAEQCAAVLDGELVSIGAAFSCIDEPDSPRDRALSLSTELSDSRVIVCDRTAAWVWGWGALPPVLTACVSISARVPSPVRRRLRAREAVIHDDEVIELHGVRVTTPTRTVIDLARHDAGEDVIDLVVVAFATGAVPRQSAVHELQRRPGIAHLRRARRRVDEAISRC